jgi:hypothetical protein
MKKNVFKHEFMVKYGKNLVKTRYENVAKNILLDRKSLWRHSKP